MEKGFLHGDMTANGYIEHVDMFENQVVVTLFDDGQIDFDSCLEKEAACQRTGDGKPLRVFKHVVNVALHLAELHNMKNLFFEGADDDLQRVYLKLLKKKAIKYTLSEDKIYLNADELKKAI